MLFIYAWKNHEKGKAPLLIFVYIAFQMLLFTKQFELIFNTLIEKSKMGLQMNKSLGLIVLIFVVLEFNQFFFRFYYKS